jgi:hypothetical protein
MPGVVGDKDRRSSRRTAFPVKESSARSARPRAAGGAGPQPPRAMATRCCSPPDSSSGNLSPSSARPRSPSSAPRTWPPLARSRPPPIASRVDLPEPLGPMIATSSPGWTAKVTSERAATQVRPEPYSRLTPRTSRVAVMAGRRPRPGPVACQPARWALAPPGAPAPRRPGGPRTARAANLGLRLKQQAVQGEGPGQIVAGSVVALQPGELLQRPHRRRSLLLDHPVDVGRWRTHGEDELDGQLLARHRLAADRPREPGVQLCAAGVGQPVDLLAVRLRIGLDKAVAFQPGQGGVDLPVVQRPEVAAGRLELALQAVAVLGAFLQQGQEAVANAHAAPYRVGTYSVWCGWATAARSGEATTPAFGG